MPDGTRPDARRLEPLLLEVADLDATGRRVARGGRRSATTIVDGVGGKQIMLDDPSGNPVELFQPKIDEARLG